MATKTAAKNVPAKVAPAKQSAVQPASATLPAHMREDVGKGVENIDNSDIEIPRLKLLQGISPELEEYRHLRAGMFWLTAAEHAFEDGFRVVPIYLDKRYILWNPRENGGGILARADDGVHWTPADRSFDVKLDKRDGGGKVVWKTRKTVKDSGLAEWGTMNPNDPDSPPAATLMYSVVLAFPDFPDLMPAVFTFQRGTIKVGRRFITKLKTQRAPTFGLVYEFSSQEDKSSAGDAFKTVLVKSDGFVEDEQLYNTYRDLNASFSATGIDIKDLESAQEDAEIGGGGEEPEEQTRDQKGRNRAKF